MRPVRFPHIILSVMFAAVLLPAAALASQDIGTVIAFTPGASVQRDGKTEPLTLQAGIRVSDTIQTDAAGRVKILFNDDSSLSLGPDTSMDMKEYADTGGKSSFSAHVTQGVLRAITGKIVEQNPAGFTLSTPKATIGIRGTIVSVRTGKDSTTVYVENTLRQVYVNDIKVPSGNKITLAPDVVRPVPVPIQPQDRRELGKDLAFRGGAGSVAAAPEAGSGGGQPTAAGQTLFAAGQSILPQDGSLRDTPLSTLNLGGGLADTLRPAGPSGPMGTVSGTLTEYGQGSGTFSFSVNLASGNISNGTLSGSNPLYSYNAAGMGGTTLPGGGFTLGAVDGSLGTASYQYTTGGPAQSAIATMTSATTTFDLLGVPNGGSVPVVYSVTNNPSTTTIAGGVGSGAMSRP